MKSCKKTFSVFKLLSVAMAVTIVLTGCTGTPGADGRDGVDGRDGKDGKTPTITINSDGYWVINGEVTTHKAVGSDGKNGVNEKNGKDGVDGKDGKDGKDGETPTITINKDGYWVINGEVTNIKAKGNDGKNGADGRDGKDGEDGQNGETPTIEINEEGYWVINGVVTKYKAVADEKETIVMEGDGQTFHRMAPSTLSFRSTAPLDEFQEVQVNGETVDPSNYTLTEGSTIVTFNIDYLKSLGTEKHEVTVVSDSVTANANFEVIEPELNEHGFYYNLPYVDIDSGFILFFFEDGTGTLGSFTESSVPFEYTINGNEFTFVVVEFGYSFSGMFKENKFSINVFDEFEGTFVLDGETIAIDENYIYCYIEELNGYDVRPIDNTKAFYEGIKTSINNYSVVKIGDGSFNSNKQLEKIEIPDSVTYIGESAFAWTDLTSFTIPDSVTSIGEGAFYDCENLASVTIPDSVTSIGEMVFDGCTRLTSITIPDSVTSIGNQAFNECKGLTSITIPDSVTSIGDRAFRQSSLTSITIPDSVTSIGAGAFSECGSLTSITIPDSVTSIGSTAFYFSGLTNITIPKSITSIEKWTFYGCENLTTINFTGAPEEWNTINKGTDWDKMTPSDKVINYNYVG